jgi:polyisoprenoid-binding protein YceI
MAVQCFIAFAFVRILQHPPRIRQIFPETAMSFYHLRSRVLLASVCLLGTDVGAAESNRYTLDPVHTRIALTVDHAGFSKAIGTVSGSSGTLIFDPDHWQDAELKAQIPVTRIDFGDVRWNKAVLAGNLLDADNHPSAEFVSTRVEPLAPDRASIHGTLTLHGVSREIVLDTKLNAAKRHPLPPFRRTIGFSATTSISRKAFGIDAWPSVIGDTIELRIEVEAIRDRTDHEDDATDSPDGASSPAGDDDTVPPSKPTTEPSL